MSTPERRRWNMRTTTGGILFCILMSMALLAPLIAPPESSLYPLRVHLQEVNLAPLAFGHLMGTDHLGRDVFAAALWASRASLTVGIMAALLSLCLGAMWGSFSAFAGGVIDNVMMRIVDGMLAIPSLILALALGTFVSTSALAQVLPEFALQLFRVTSYSQGLLPLITVIFVVSATAWLESARLARARVLSIRNKDYVTAAVSIGTGTGGILIRHLLPNIAPILVVEATLLVSEAVLMEAGLSFLGLGLGPGIPSWGGMLASSETSLLQGNWWAALVPGLFLSATVLSVNMLGEGWLESTGSRYLQAADRPAP